MSKITFTPAQQALLGHLCEHWKQQAQLANSSAQALADEKEVKQLQRRAVHYRACASELKTVLESGDLPAGVGFQVRGG